MEAPARQSLAANVCVLRMLCICAIAASALVTSHAHADEPTFFDRVTDWFNPDKTPGDLAGPDATPYSVDFDVGGGERSVRSAVTSASNLETLKRQTPAGSAGLIRRAFADRE